MIAIDLKYISKSDDKLFSLAQEHYVKLIKPYAKLNVAPIWSAAIEKAQKIGGAQAQEAYARAFAAQPSRYSIALNAEGKALDTAGFAALIASRPSFCFYIGGAYGLNRSFCDACDLSVSLSPLTFSQSLARVVLLEQLYRAFTIGANHPYNK